LTNLDDKQGGVSLRMLGPHLSVGRAGRQRQHGFALCLLLGHTTYDLSSTYWMMTGNARSFWPAIAATAPSNFTPKPSIGAPSGMSTSSAALRSASESIPPYFLMARGSTSGQEEVSIGGRHADMRRPDGHARLHLVELFGPPS